MADATVIGQGAFLRGHIRGEGELEILGRVEGDVEVDGDVTIGEGALVRADVSGRRIVVRGAVAGNLTATEGLRLEEGARVVGDLRATTIGIAQGALVRGHVQTSEAPAVTRRPEVTSRSEPRPLSRSEARPAPGRAARVGRPELHAVGRAPAAPARADGVTAPKAASSAVATAVERPAPPPPLVPALKRGARGAMKKRGAR